MSNSIHATVEARPETVNRPTHPVPLRIGIVLTVLLSVVAVIPAVFDVGFDGTGWDVVVVLVAITTPLIALAAIVLAPFAWRGRRAPSWGLIVVLLAGIPSALPPFLHAPGELPPEASISAAIGIAVSLVLAALILVGMRRSAARTRRSAVR